MATSSDRVSRSVNGYKHGRVPRAVRREQLLQLAEEQFMEKGHDGFSIDDLCRAAGVSRPIIYEHFGSKDGIYIACLTRIRAEFEQALLAAAAESPDLASTTQNWNTKGYSWSDGGCGIGGCYSHIQPPNKKACVFSNETEAYSATVIWSAGTARR